MAAAASSEDNWAALERLDEEAAGPAGAAPDEPGDPYEELEREADALLGKLPDDPELASKPLITKLRKQLAGRARAEKAAYDRGREEAITEFRGKAEREQALDRLGIPGPLRALLDGVDLGDEATVNAKIEALRAAGVTWKRPAGAAPAAGKQPDSEETAAPPDPASIVGAFQAAQANGVPAAGGLLSRVAQSGLGAIQSGQDASDFEQQLNQQIRAMGQQRGAGTMG